MLSLQLTASLNSTLKNRLYLASIHSFEYFELLQYWNKYNNHIKKVFYFLVVVRVLCNEKSVM